MEDRGRRLVAAEECVDHGRVEGEEEIKAIAEAEEKIQRTISPFNSALVGYAAGMERSAAGPELDDFASSCGGRTRDKT